MRASFLASCSARTRRTTCGWKRFRSSCFGSLNDALRGDVVPVGKACDILRTAVMAVMAPRKRCEDSPAGASGVIRL